MELPHLGQHCSEPTCKQLDLLPVKCDACSGVFCGEHMSYNNHACPGAYKKDIHVPVCPLCDTPIPIKRGDPPDIAVSRHIDSNCESDTAKDRRKVFTNRCSLKSCKVHELMPIKCSQCEQNFCLKHRHPADHQCTPTTVSSKAAEAALARQQKSSRSEIRVGPFKVTGSTASHKPGRQGKAKNSASVQRRKDEEEATTRTVAAPFQEGQPPPTRVMSAEQKAQEDEDYDLARAIQQSERDMYTSSRNSSNHSGRCEVS